MAQTNQLSTLLLKEWPRTIAETMATATNSLNVPNCFDLAITLGLKAVNSLANDQINYRMIIYWREHSN